MSNIQGWKRTHSKAIVHVDADAFFASCEQAVHPEYRGKPVVTGKERGIVAAASYEAKKFGVQRGVALWDVPKMCPGAIILPSNYETYSLFSKRMFDIMRRFTSEVEEYGVDEGFADITGLRRPLHMSYPQITAKLKDTLERELGITVSLGLASSKVLAKLGSGWNKPSGLTVFSRYNRETFLRKAQAQDIWGIGPQTAKHLEKFGVRTAWEFAQQSEDWVNKHMAKPHQEIWQELNGHAVYDIHAGERQAYASISKTRTFTPPSSDRSVVFAQLSKNIENAFIKARRHSLATNKMIVFVKNQQFRVRGAESILSRPTAFPNEVLPIAEKLFDELFDPSDQYRATGAILVNLHTDEHIQMNLFESPVQLEKMKSLYGTVDQLAKRYGKHTVFLGSSFAAQTRDQHERTRGDAPEAKRRRATSINKRKFVDLPMLLGDVN